jgi:polyhydroxybutyrate depolymerase
VPLTVPEGYDPATPGLLVLGLHGYTSFGNELSTYLNLTQQADSQDFLLATPEGTTDAKGEQFWNATNACCDFFDTEVDDSAFLAQLITTLEEQYAVDPARVYVVGHSNGGFMALRVACDHADLVTAVVSIAGEQALDPAACTPTRPVSVLQVQGDADETVAYDGGTIAPDGTYPGAQATAEAWRSLDACSPEAGDGTPLDLEMTLDGAETSVRTWTGCREGTEVGLWTIAGAKHVPTWSADGPAAIVGWLLAQHRQG